MGTKGAWFVMVQTYALSPKVLRKALQRTFWRFQWIATLSFFVFGVYLASFDQPVNWNTALPLVLVIALAYFLIIFYSYRSQMRLLYSVRVELDNSSVLYRQLGEEPVRIMRADITAVRERKDGFLIETVDPGETLLLPRGLSNDGDQVLRAVLDAWVGVDSSAMVQTKQERGLFFAGLGLGLLVLLFANSLWSILPLGIALTGYGVYVERRLTRQKDTPPGLVRSYNTGFSFLLFMILMKSCFISFLMLTVR